jgi:O-antigen/teichoic acid export membrane protein
VSSEAQRRESLRPSLPERYNWLRTWWQRARPDDLSIVFRKRGIARKIARTAGFNVTSTVAAGVTGVLLARVLGPAVRGEYAAITSWFGMVLMIGSMGQPAAVCFFVARDPARARQYVATSRAMMLCTGAVALAAGMLVAPILAHGHPDVIVAYRIAFAASVFAFVGASYTFALQARDQSRWNVVRVSQPVLSLIAVVVLWRLRLLTLDITLVILAGTMMLQLAWAYYGCRKAELVPGRPSRALVRPLSSYGIAQIAAVTPAVLNLQLDQLVLSQTVPPADLGRYAVAVSLSLLPIPFVAAIGNVAFPRLAAETSVTGATRRLQRVAVLGSAGIAIGMLIPLSAAAYWLVPLVFGASYRASVPLLWMLVPGAVFLACGQVVGDLLRGRNHPSVVAWSQGIAAVFTVVLLIALLPLIGVAGAAVASTIAYGIALGVMLRRLSRLPRHARGTGRPRPALTDQPVMEH